MRVRSQISGIASFGVMGYWKWVELDQGWKSKVRDSVSQANGSQDEAVRKVRVTVCVFWEEQESGSRRVPGA